MPPIIAIFILGSIAGLIMMAVEFVVNVATAIDAFVADIGGWYVAAAISAGLIVLMVLLVRSGRQSERRDLLRAIPHQVDGRIAEAAAEYHQAADALKHAVAELDAKRAPTFWDWIEAAEAALAECAGILLETEQMIEEYNDEAPGHKLKPTEIDPVPQPALSRTLDLMREQVKITQEALAVPVFANIYEQRRAAAQLREQQAEADEAVMATLQQILEETEHTAESADRARRASKRAAGDWF